jgi:hypothetical protein
MVFVAEAGRKVRQGDVLDAVDLLPRYFSSERQFQAWVESRAAERGWIAFHDHDSRRNAAGFPDLLLIRERVVWLELKWGRGKVRPKQEEFIAALRAAGQEVHVYWPKDIPRILEVLR